MIYFVSVLVDKILLYLTIWIYFFQSYFYNDDLFNFNYMQAKAAVGNYKEAEEASLCFCYLSTV